MGEIKRIEKEILVRDIPIGILISVIGLYVVYLIFWLTNFPSALIILSIFILVHIAEFILYLGFRVIKGIKTLIEVKIIDAPGDNKREQPADAGRNTTSPE